MNAIRQPDFVGIARLVAALDPGLIRRHGGCSQLSHGA